MTSPHAERYAEILTQPVTSVLNEVDVSLTEGEASVVGMANLQTRIMAAVRALDWDRHDLPDHDFGYREDEIGERPLKPVKYAERLMMFAVDDGFMLVSLCENYRPDSLADQTDFAAALKRSKHTLLSVSTIPDKYKSALFNAALRYPDLSEIFIGFTIPGDPVALEQDEKGRDRFAWNPVIQEWIEGSRTPTSGCLANKIVIETAQKKKKVLIHHFWETLITAMYG